MPSYESDGLQLFYAERGAGEPLLFLNGLSGDHLYWNGQLRFFSKHYRSIATDNRDVGQSSLSPGAYTPRELAADTLRLMDALKLPPAHVLGLSMGGMIAQEIALAAPERVKSLLLVDTMARSDDWFRGTLRAFELIRRQVGDTPGFFDAILSWWVSPTFANHAERSDWLRWLLRQSPYPQCLEGFVRQIDALGRHDAYERLPALRCPVLVLAGEDDCVCPVRYSRELAERIPQAELVLLPGVGHAPPIEDPSQFNRTVAEFLGHVAERPQAPAK